MGGAGAASPSAASSCTVTLRVLLARRLQARDETQVRASREEVRGPEVSKKNPQSNALKEREIDDR